MQNFLRSFGFFAFLLTALLGFRAPTQASEIYQEMPIYNIGFSVNRSTPQELRDQSVYRWMSGSFRIENKQGRGSVFGSGTLCYYDNKTNTGYIISCGHLFNGGEKQAYIDTWYKNGVKLPSPQRFTADIISLDKSQDISFLKFTPDWSPNEYFPIALENTKIELGEYLWSVGCDNAKEVAAYKVKSIGMQSNFLATTENSPRSGRSGGSLINQEGYYVGICVRSSDPVGGSGTGLFVAFRDINKYCKKSNLTFLLGLNKNKLFEIPIIDMIGPQGDYKNYIPIP